MDTIIDDEQLDSRKGNQTAAEIFFQLATKHHKDLRDLQNTIRDTIK
jgi:hypothetical protein